MTQGPKDPPGVSRFPRKGWSPNFVTVRPPFEFRLITQVTVL